MAVLTVTPQSGTVGLDDQQVLRLVIPRTANKIAPDRMESRSGQRRLYLVRAELWDTINPMVRGLLKRQFASFMSLSPRLLECVTVHS